ncbi:MULTISPECIES: 16S rRNA (adenine(1518)-N(6)/adenine(1519)-N(6))-dimethyltransferase RsmA [unclassified Fusibacter]|uniref:16S rRNA (adenine(1518)-N(6)/adenine(1519)-N(6))- dimethyltransferase RsmA n=1 Tax=unclassified Fusibacter TaxID=2624464 RepID=UPI001011B460|nr:MULTISPECIES: 16S rRNA (adenine(1518)-N(6)/adenine(1519)-N(6))-dimethyltransferase RsmA [unclassified Fusibacter]MCK8059228.1 16S rRNA (adenine(1518)-N(6)/adenine(1519)-N(6))-dimethyltransferase RsmA [Fusibacter sp. A2]NPE21308.1 16S rRNA (adenine(1518)-N(6)/adenine(1519)-N(6))-dimethyltransferase RsmA [Fusibacter sp. A1]RXV62572.1 16S rRNA (adenine(1518)-N(6)/adenine(1519)-N(6))-dimethyltransferase RsmA [Fusibacter sp. A1]
MSKLTSFHYIKSTMEQHGVNFSKSLGQNFLIDSNIVENIADGAQIGPNDGVLEIGPGIGSLTEALLNRAKKVVSVEIDRMLWPILESHFGSAPHFELIKEDVLKLDLKALIAEKFSECEKVKVVANLPYYITTPIIMKFLEDGIPVSDIVVMIQKEVADRMSADKDNKTYGSLSVAVQFYAEPSVLFKVPRTVFVPQPNVESSVIRLKIRENPPVDVVSREMFFKTVKASFAKRRKTLLNTVTSTMGIDKDAFKAICEKLAISPSIRAENLDIVAFGRLSNEIYDYFKALD